jgi:hypothetical protein
MKKNEWTEVTKNGAKSKPKPPPSPPPPPVPITLFVSPSIAAQGTPATTDSTFPPARSTPSTTNTPTPLPTTQPARMKTKPQKKEKKEYKRIKPYFYTVDVEQYSKIAQNANKLPKVVALEPAQSSAKYVYFIFINFYYLPCIFSKDKKVSLSLLTGTPPLSSPPLS